MSPLLQAFCLLVLMAAAGGLGYTLGKVRYSLTSEEQGNHDAMVFQRGWAAGYDAGLCLPPRPGVADGHDDLGMTLGDYGV